MNIRHALLDGLGNKQALGVRHYSEYAILTLTNAIQTSATWTDGTDLCILNFCTQFSADNLSGYSERVELRNLRKMDAGQFAVEVK